MKTSDHGRKDGESPIYGPDCEESVRLRAIALVRRLSGPPFNLNCAPVREATRISRIVATGKLHAHGRVTWKGDGYVVELKASLAAGRKAFTLGHEIAHTFFMKPDTAHTSQRTDDVTGGFSTDQREEYLCDIAASEMLMPAAALLKPGTICSPDELALPENSFLLRALEYRPSALSVLALAREFGTSLAATARRVAEMGLWSCHVGFWVLREDCVEFSHGFASPTLGSKVLRGFKALPSSVVGVAALRKTRTKGWSDIGLVGPHDSANGKVYADAVPIGGGRVLTVAVLEAGAEHLVAGFEKKLTSKQRPLRFVPPE